jgi:hypothetical protein
MLVTARIEIPLALMDKNYAYVCDTCGATKDFQFSGLIAERETERHLDRGHDVTLYEWEVPPLERLCIVKGFKVRNGRPYAMIALGTRPQEQRPDFPEGVSSNGT